MALSSSLKEKIVSRHNEMFDAFLLGDIDGFTTWWVDNIVIYGTAISEVFTNKQVAYDFYKSTRDQVTGLIRIENRNINVFEQNGYMILTEDSDFHVKVAEEWIFYHYSRLTEVWSEKNGDWYLTHIHISYPDGYAGEGQQINPDQLRSENIKLQAAVEERTAELAQKNRELQIEAALEKVRSRSLIMQSSDELSEVVKTVFDNLRDLHFDLTDSAVVINLFQEDSDDIVQWITDNEQTYPRSFRHPHFDNPILNDIKSARKNGVDYFSSVYSFEDKNAFWNYYFEYTDFSRFPDHIKQDILQRKNYAQSMALQQFTGILHPNIDGRVLDHEEVQILKRFSVVFEQAYIRFLDLQKAEGQVREAQIEAALERVRSRTMAMQRSEELSVVAHLLFEEFKTLYSASAHVLSRAFVITVDEQSKQFTFFITTTDGEYLQTAYPLPFDEPTNGLPLFQCWKNQDELLVNVLEGDVYKAWLHYLDSIELYVTPEVRQMNRRINNYSRFTKGFIGITSVDKLNDTGLVLLQRFTKVFDQTYTRFLDLQEAEANKKSAVRQAAIDRIRADIASMRSVEDLDRLIPLIWNELHTLQIPFIRCGIFIMNEKEQTINTFLSTPDGKSIASFPLSYEASANITDVVGHWQRDELYIAQWGIDSFNSLADSLLERKIIQEREQYLTSIPSTGIYLHFVPFLQGMLYVGNTETLSKEAISILQAVSNAFSTAYARYQDFSNLEAAKKEIEKTLQDLKQTQQQLIQAEKMASLGELTAGIAHEIQNPLNFVNNFSEVSNELVDEMNAELAKGDIEEAKLIANDVKQNLEKITHHGRRADAIVKGMLQHSRTSSGKKEATDINALCDEYLRLAYHGLRAKDNSFNATLVTDFDNTIQKIQIQSQEMGRVILNLINNALYAVGEKRKQFPNDFEPKVFIRTKRNKQSIEISVEDNGMGIPASIKDKIFQPFFTTKPTGQGTGLGLSLSYDIVTKTHNGELRCETKHLIGQPNLNADQTGTIFTIILPYIQS